MRDYNEHRHFIKGADVEEMIVNLIHRNRNKTIVMVFEGDRRNVRLDIHERGTFDVDSDEDISGLGFSDEVQTTMMKDWDMMQKLKFNFALPTLKGVYITDYILNRKR